MTGGAFDSAEQKAGGRLARSMFIAAFAGRVEWECFRIEEVMLFYSGIPEYPPCPAVFLSGPEKIFLIRQGWIYAIYIKNAEKYTGCFSAFSEFICRSRRGTVGNLD